MCWEESNGATLQSRRQGKALRATSAPQEAPQRVEDEAVQGLGSRRTGFQGKGQDSEGREIGQIWGKTLKMTQQEATGRNPSSAEHQKGLAGLRQGPRELHKENVLEAPRKGPSQRLNRKGQTCCRGATVKGVR